MISEGDQVAAQEYSDNHCRQLFPGKVSDNINQYFSEGVLPTEPQVAAKVVTQVTMYTIVDVDGILYYNGQKGDSLRAAVPCSLQQSMMEEYYSGIMAGHFSGLKVYKAMLRQ